MAQHTVSRESETRLVLAGDGSSRRYLNGTVHRLARVEQGDTVSYVIRSEQRLPEVLVVGLDDADSQAIIDGLPVGIDEEAVDRLLLRLEQDEPDVRSEEAVTGKLVFVDPVLTVVAGDRRWDFVPDRESIPTIRSIDSTRDGVDLRLRMPDDERIRIEVDPEDSEATHRAVAVMKTARPVHDIDGTIRWQYGIVSIGMFNAAERMSSVFASLGQDGWELVTIYDKASNWLSGMEKGFMLFKRPVDSSTTLRPSEWCRTIDRVGT